MQGVLVRGTYLSLRSDGYANVQLSARTGGSQIVSARVAVPNEIAQNDIVYLLQEEIVGKDYVIIGSLDLSLPGGPFYTGMVVQTATPTAPAGWLLCNGSAVSRVTYEDLYAKIGTTFGAGDGSTTFNLPNLAAPYTNINNIIKT